VNLWHITNHKVINISKEQEINRVTYGGDLVFRAFSERRERERERRRAARELNLILLAYHF